MRRYQLQLQLPSQSQAVYIFSCQDMTIAQYETQKIIQKAQIEITQRFEIQSLAQWDTFKQESLNYDLFSEPKAYIIQLDKSGFPAKQFFNLSPGPDEIYFIHTQQFKHAFLEHLAQDKNCFWYGMYQPSPQDLWQWFSKALLPKDFKFQPDVAPWFLQQNELGFRHYAQLLEHIHLSYQAPTTLSLAELQNHIGFTTQQDSQALVDAWMLNQKDILLEKCQRLQVSQQDFTLLIWILNRTLQVWHALLMGKKTPREIYQDFKIWNKHIPLFEKSYPHLKLDKVNQALILLHEMDRCFKSYQYLPAQLKLEQLLLGYPYE
jgi:DNA polymerase III delta subunit